MLDIKALRDRPDVVFENLSRRGYVLDLTRLHQLDSEQKQAMQAAEKLLADRNDTTKRVGRLIREGKAVEEAKASVQSTIDAIDAQLNAAVMKVNAAKNAMNEFMMQIPNLLHESVPEGQSEDDNVVISEHGEKRQFSFEPKNHVDIGEGLQLLNFPAAAKITGARFSVMQGALAKLHRVLAQWMLDIHVSQHGYSEVYVPYIVNSDSLQGTGQLPKFEEELFKLKGDKDFYLIPTAEVPVTNLFRDRILQPQEIEGHLRFVAHTPCFRSEAGAHGRDVRGLIRQHQFEKVELVQIVKPADGERALEQVTSDAEYILESLGLPYRKVLLCSGDTGFGSSKTYDLEVWVPSQNQYREISSCSHFGDFQSRRMNARWKNPETKKTEYLHTVNGSALAVGRTLVAILENYQQEDGSIKIPAPLQSMMGCEKIG